MLRIIVAIGVVVAVTAIASGCGSSSLESIVRRDSAQTWGESNPRILSVESVELAGGSREHVVRLQGNFLFNCNAPGCHASRTHYAVLEIGDAGTTGYSGSSNAEEAAIAAARNADPRFGIFPDFESILVRCTVPGGWGGDIAGTCSTDHARHGVAFTEHWPLSRPAGTRHRATWTVTLGPSHRVKWVRLSGDQPPQLWTTATQPPVPPLSVTRARHELGYLRVFPSFPGTRPCSFSGGGPRLGSAHTFHGTCTTKLLPRAGNRPALGFLESWRQGKREFTGGWIVTLRHDDTVLRVRITGSNPPQSWR